MNRGALFVGFVHLFFYFNINVVCVCVCVCVFFLFFCFFFVNERTVDTNRENKSVWGIRNMQHLHIQCNRSSRRRKQGNKTASTDHGEMLWYLFRMSINTRK
jgi:Na+/melibiose symporter-like transporter